MLLDQRGLSQSELARRVGVKQTTISQLIRGLSRSSSHLHTIARELGTTPAFLVGDVDDSADDVALPPTPSQVAEQLNSVMLPYFPADFSMGGGRVIDDAVPSEMIPFSKGWLRARIHGRFDEVMLINGRGDSMEPTISDGDVLAVDKAQRAVLDQDLIWAFSYGDLGMVKRLRRQPKGGYLVMSDNKRVRDFKAADDEIAIVGRVFWIGRWS